MGFVLALFAFVFLIGGLATHLVSFMTPNMYENKIIALDHQGLFRRCGGVRGVVTGCYWWDRDVFSSDPSKFFMFFFEGDVKFTKKKLFSFKNGYKLSWYYR
jgi:hypothetical protein